MSFPEYPDAAVAEIEEVLGWIEVNPDGKWEDVPKLFAQYKRWRDIIYGVPPLLNGSGTMRSVPGLTSFGRAFLLEQRRRSATSDYVDLDQIAAVVNRSKSLLEKLKRRKKNPLPDPDVKGGGGKKDEWIWSRIRPWLEAEFSRHLPETFPRRK
jgi:hypothetical protein